LLTHATPRALHKNLHPLLKLWYTSSHNPSLVELRSKYGAFPSFWQELKSWGGWRDVHKLYLTSTEKKRDAPGNPNNRGGGNPNNSGGGNPNNAGGSPAAPADRGRARKSRWGAAASPAAAPSGNSRAALTLSNGVTLPASQIDAYNSLNMALKKTQGKILTLPMDVKRIDTLPKGHADRSPSPPPTYDNYGRKTNSREVRYKEKYEIEVQDIHEKLFDLNPRLLPPTFKKRKKLAKIFIPVEKHPTYNFIGLM